MKITKAEVTDHLVLTDLTKKSKAFWNYTQKQLDEWDEVLTITENYILQNEVYNLKINNEVVAYYSYFKIEDETVKLDNLFVLPEFIGNKYGVYLMKDFIARVNKKRIKLVRLTSDPNSVNFYKKLGFRQVGQIETSIKNRFMPVMEKKLP